jgi:fructose-1,6-bisphosphatase
MVNTNRSNMYCVMDQVMSDTKHSIFPLNRSYFSQVLIFLRGNRRGQLSHRFLFGIMSLYITTIEQLIDLITYCSSKYTRSKLRKALPKEYTIEVIFHKF